MKVLIIGSGGREHALAWRAALSDQVDTVYVAPGNAGTALEQNVQNVAVSSDDIDGLLDFAVSQAIDLTIVGPEAPLVAGVVDRFSAAGLACFGPTAAAAQLEGSKAFAKDFMARHGIPTAAYGNFTDIDDAIAIAALTQSLLHYLYRLRKQHMHGREFHRFLVSQNRWRAIRYGYDEGFVDFTRRSIVPISELLPQIVEMVSEDAQALDCVDELQQLLRIPERGTSAHQQLAIYQREIGQGHNQQTALNAVGDFLIEKTIETPMKPRTNLGNRYQTSINDGFSPVSFFSRLMVAHSAIKNAAIPIITFWAILTTAAAFTAGAGRGRASRVSTGAGSASSGGGSAPSGNVVGVVSTGAPGMYPATRWTHSTPGR